MGARDDTRGAGRPAAGALRAERRAARLRAVQALYQIEMTGQSPGQVLEEFLAHRLDDSVAGLETGRVDTALLSTLVEGVVAKRSDLDAMIAAVLDPNWAFERLQLLLRVILRAGAYELSELTDVPARAAVAEYVDLAHAFFDGKEPGLANGVLDRLGRALRSEEFGAGSGEATWAAVLPEGEGER
jgi:N utilization substance protein B